MYTRNPAYANANTVAASRIRKVFFVLLVYAIAIANICYADTHKILDVDAPAGAVVEDPKILTCP